MGVDAKRLTIGIIGYGFVGKAMASLFPDFDKVIIDVNTQHTINDIDVCGIVFVCLPTPTKNSVCDYTVLLNEVSKLTHLDIPVVIKSTVTPDFFEEEKVKQIKHLVYIPEFLRESHAEHDIRNNEFLYVAGKHEDRSSVLQFFANSDIDVIPVIYETENYRAVSLAKYAINSFLATKVAFMNELNELAGSDYNEIASMLKLEPRIGKTHLDVPGPDGKYGFGGSCFPKDTKAVTSYAEESNIELSILKQVCKTNDRYRNKR